MKCPKCGEEIANDSVFCEYCGTEIRNDNANKIDNTKRVDIRWALLSAMLIATFAMWMRWINSIVYDWNDVEFEGLLAMISPTILFLISLWNRIKHKIATSFVIIMGVFLLLNCAMFKDVVFWHEWVEWFDDQHYHVHFYKDFGQFAWGIASVLFGCYLIYVIVAHKKEWRF